MNQALIARINQGQAVIAVIGLGYVGLPLALRFVEAGHRVLGLDIDSARVDRLNDGLSYISHIPGARIAAALAAGLQASGDFARLAEADAILICVPTPLNRYREPDLGCVLGALEACLPHVRAGQVLSLESTTYPGTTEEELLPRLRARGLVVGEEVFLVYAPEREDPGNPLDARRIPKVCAGITAACLEVGSALYGRVVERVVPVSSTRVAEMTKLLENIHRAVNIGLVNEMKTVADKMDIDIHEVIRAASTKPFGFVPYQPGPGLGGHCIPIDPFYLTWKARAFGIHTRFIELAGEVNAAMPHYVIGKVVEALNAHGKPVRGSRVLVLGVAYKKNVDDLRESPALFIMERLHELGAHLHYSDPFVPQLAAGASRPALASVAVQDERLGDYDCVLLATDHDGLDYPLIQRSARLIVDCRGRFLERAAHIFKA